MKILFHYSVFCLLFLLSRASVAQDITTCDQLIVEGVNEMNNKNHTQSLETLTKAKTLAAENNWPKQSFLAINNIGANYYLMLDYGEALDNYFEAYKIALKELDANYEMIVLNNIAILYLRENKLNKAEEYYKRAFDIATEKNDSLKIGLYALNLASLANGKMELKEAENYLSISISNLGDSSFIVNQVYLVKAQNLILKKKYEEAKHIIEEILPNLDSPEMSENRIMAYLLLSSVYENQNETDKAIKFAKLARNDPEASVENLIEVYDELVQLYRKSGDDDTAFLFKDSIILAKDSLNKIKNGKLFENSRIKFELQNYQKELSLSQQRLKSERKVFYLILIAIVVAIMIGLWAVRNYFIKQKQKKIIAENHQKITELKLENEKNDKILLEQQLKEKETLNLLEQEKLKNEIESKNRQLVTKAQLLSSHNELIEGIINALLSDKEISQNPNLKMSVSKLKNQLRNYTGWTDFFTHFEEVNQSFLKSLKEKYPTLNQNDVRFLSYVYMNLTIKEIAAMFNITMEACRKRKERIIKKMGIGEEKDLYDYILSL